MKNKLHTYTYLLGVVCTGWALTTACEDQSEEVTSLEHNRLFAPFGLEAKVNNTVNVRLSWTSNPEACGYQIEIFADDSLTFAGSPVRTYENISDEDIPYDITGLEGDTKYSARLKCIGENINDSKWTGIFFRTDAEQLLKEIEEEHISATTVQLHFEAGRTFTKVQITSHEENAESKDIDITSEDLQAGYVTISGLTGNTTYTAKLLNGEKNCGSRSFTTLIDPSTAIVVDENKNLQQAIDEATDEKYTILIPAGKTFEIEEVTINKKVEIIGERFKNKPIMIGKFNLGENSDVLLRNLIMDGNNYEVKRMFTYEEGTVAQGIQIEACEIKGYKEGVFTINGPTIGIEAIILNNNLIYDIKCDGGDLLDSRTGGIRALTITNNTFYNCSQIKNREFIRLDGDENKKPWIENISEYTITLEKNTIVGADSKGFKRLMYVRYPGATVNMKNNLIVKFSSYLNDQKYIESDHVNCHNNRYYEANNAGVINYKINDVPTEVYRDPNCTDSKFADPKFKDAAHGDFTITNEDLIIDKVGDPRWLP